MNDKKQILNSRYSYVPFEVLSCSSEEINTNFNNLNSPEIRSNFWESTKLPDYPITILLKLKYRVELDFCLICAKESMEIDDIKIFITDSIGNGFLDLQFFKSGDVCNLKDTPIQIGLRGVGNIMKLVFNKKMRKDRLDNPFNKIGVNVFKIWGREAPLGLSKIQNSFLEREYDKVRYDRTLIELGIDVVSLEFWERFDSGNFTAPVDMTTRETIICMLKKKKFFIQQEDFLAAKKLKEDLLIVLELGKDINYLQKDLEFELAKENYSEAEKLKNKIKDLKKRRDNFDVEYETARYERMITMGSIFEEDEEDLKFKTKLMEMELKEKREKEMREEILRKRKEQEKENYRDEIVVEKKIRIVTPERKVIKKEIKEFSAKKQEIKKNEGDKDLSKYFVKYIKEINGMEEDWINSIPIEVLSNLKTSGLLEVFGYGVWGAIFNSTWRARKVAAEAVLNFTKQPILKKYQENKSPLFEGCCEIARLVLNDKVSQNYMIALKILEICFNKPICDNTVSPDLIEKNLKELFDPISNRITGINQKIRDQSLGSLLFIFSLHPDKLHILVDHLLQIMQKPDQLNPHKLVLKKLEEIKTFTLIGYMCITKNFVEVCESDLFLKVLENLVVPCLYHDEWEIKKISVDTIISFYKKYPEVVLDILNQQNLKSSIMDYLNEKIQEANQDLYLKNRSQKLTSNLPLKIVPEDLNENNYTHSYIQEKPTKKNISLKTPKNVIKSVRK